MMVSFLSKIHDCAFTGVLPLSQEFINGSSVDKIVEHRLVRLVRQIFSSPRIQLYSNDLLRTYAAYPVGAYVHRPNQ